MFGALLSGAVGGAGKAVEDVADASIASRLKLDFERQMSSIMQEREAARADIQRQLQVSGADQSIRVNQAQIDAKRADEDAQTGKTNAARKGLIDAHVQDKLGAIYGQKPDMAGVSDEERAAVMPNADELAGIDLRAARETGASESGIVSQLNTMENARQREQAAKDNAQHRRETLEETKRHHQATEGLMGQRIVSGRGSGIAQEKWDYKQIKDHIKDNEAYYTFESVSGDKPAVDMQVKQVYSRLVKTFGPEAADAKFDDIMSRADQKTKGMPPEAKQAAIRAEVASLAERMSQGRQHTDAQEVGAGKGETAHNQPAKETVKSKPVPEVVGLSPKQEMKAELAALTARLEQDDKAPSIFSSSLADRIARGESAKMALGERNRIEQRVSVLRQRIADERHSGR